MILMPGMVDGHRHVWHTVDVGRAVKTQPSSYSQYNQWRMKSVVTMTPEDHYLGGYIGGLIAIDTGVTCILDYAHGQNTAEKALGASKGLKDSGISGWYGMQLGHNATYGPGSTIGFAEANAQRVTAQEVHWQQAERLLKEVFSDSDGLLQMGLAPAAGTGQPMEKIKAEFERARATGVKMLIAHIHKPEKPLAAGLMGHKDSGITDLHEAGLLGPDYHISHGNRLTDDELKMMRDTGGMICATAMGEFPYMSQSFRGPSVHGRAREAGVAVGIGVDVSSAMVQEYFEHCRAAFWNLYLEPAGVKIASKYRSEDTLDFATALGAKAVRLGDVTGTITVGKRADLLLLKTDRIGFARQGTLADRVLNFALTEDIDSVWINGKIRKKNGKMIGVDWAKLKSQMDEVQKRIGPQQATITFT